MKYNNALERKLFNKKWKGLREKYYKAGMPDESIDAMQCFDWQQHNAERTYAEHNVFLEELREPGEEVGEMPAVLVNKYADQVFSKYDTYGTHSRYWWFEEIEPRINLKVLSKLTDEEKELLTLFFKDGYTQKECAVILHITQSAVSYRIRKILSKLNKK